MAIKFKGDTTVAIINSIKKAEVDTVYRCFDSGVLLSNEIINHGDFVSWDGTKWIKRSDLSYLIDNAAAPIGQQIMSNIAPAYVKQPYPANSYVTKDGVLYTNAAAIDTAEDWTPAHWARTTVAEMMAGAGDSGYTEKTISFSSSPYDIEVKQKEVITAVISGLWDGAANILLDDGCNDAVICLKRSPSSYHIDLSDVVIKRGTQTIQQQSTFGTVYVTGVSADTCGIETDYVNSPVLHSSYIIEIKGSFAIVHTE